MTFDPFREVRDAVRPSAAAGSLSDVTATKIAGRHRVDIADVRRLYAQECTRLHPDPRNPGAATQATEPIATVPEAPLSEGNTGDNGAKGPPGPLAAAPGAEGEADTPNTGAAPKATEQPQPIQSPAPAQAGADQTLPETSPRDPDPAAAPVTIDTTWPAKAEPADPPPGVCRAEIVGAQVDHICLRTVDANGHHDGPHQCADHHGRDATAGVCGGLWTGGPMACEAYPEPVEGVPASTIVKWAADVAGGYGTFVDLPPLPDDEQAQAPDMLLVSNAVLALIMLGDEQLPDQVRRLLDTALDDAQELHRALRDHHRQADLIAERAILAARLAEIDQALGHDDPDMANDEDPALPTAGSNHRTPFTCECGAQVTQGGRGAHRTRSKAHAVWAAASGGGTA